MSVCSTEWDVKKYTRMRHSQKQNSKVFWGHSPFLKHYPIKVPTKMSFPDPAVALVGLETPLSIPLG